MSSNGERIEFKVHAALLTHYIKRQAGTLQKAVMEAVCNAVDAKASRVDVSIEANRVVVTDDGHGIPDRESIEQFFATFGEPQKEGADKTYGCFRMGRGQLFAFGRNTWRTNQFVMTVDFESDSETFRLDVTDRPRPGCVVDIELYQGLSLGRIETCLSELRLMARYMSGEVFVNGEQVNTPPDQMSWTHETDVFDARLRPGGNLAVYDRGVLVKEFGAGAYSVGGTVLVKEPLRLNVARNDIMHDCPVWRRCERGLRAVAREFSGRSRGRRVSSIEDRRDLAACAVLNRDMPEGLRPERAKLIRNVDRRWREVRDLWADKWRQRVYMPPEGVDWKTRMHLTELHRIGAVYVLDRATLAAFGAADLQGVLGSVDAIRSNAFDSGRSARSPSLAPWVVVADDDPVLRPDEHFELVPKKEWTLREQVVLELLNRHLFSGCWHVRAWDRPTPRVVTLGLGGDHVNAWTDGVEYVAVNRKFLDRLMNDTASLATIGYWQILVSTCVEQHLFDAPTTGEHAMSKSQLARWRSVSRMACGFLLPVLYIANSLPKAARKAKLKLSATALKRMDGLSRQIANLEAWEATIADYESE